MSEARQRWLDEGVEMLTQEGGAGALRIDRIAPRLGLTRGSFYHHFKGAADFKRELLDHLEKRQLGAFSEVIAEERSDEGRTAHETTASLISRLAAARSRLRRPRLEAALRAWALTDPDAARTQAAIDEGRLEMIRSVWRQVTDDEDEVRMAALLPYVIAIGSSAIMPPLSDEDLALLYERIVALVRIGIADHTTPGEAHIDRQQESTP